MAASQRTLQMPFAKGIFLQLVDTELLTQSFWFWRVFGFGEFFGVGGFFFQCCFCNSIGMIKFF